MIHKITNLRSEMIKFVLLSIAVIIVLLGIYTYNNQTAEKSVPKPAVSKKQLDVRKTEISIVTQKVKEKESSVKNITVKSPKVVSTELTQEILNEQELDKGLTLENIENMDVSDEEKELLIADMVYHQTSTNENARVLTYEEGLELIANDVKNGIIE